MMDPVFDLNRINLVSHLLSIGMPEPDSEEIEPEVAETLRTAREQMRAIPAAIRSIKEAKRDFVLLGEAIDRLLVITQKACGLEDDDLEGRGALEVEFVRLSHIVAEIAGRAQYTGPTLSIKTRAQAKGSYKVLKHLGPVKDCLAAQLAEQESLIVDAVLQTIDFLEAVSESYPQAASVSPIQDLLQRVSGIREGDQTDIQVGLAPKDGFH